jgi:hypothetical protein
MYTVSGKTSGVGTTARPCVSIYAPAGNGFVIREIAVWNTTVTACEYKIARLTTAGTPGSGLTEVEYAADLRDPSATAFDAHSADATVGNTIRYMPVGAAIGAGFYYTWGGNGLVVPSGTANGIGIVLATGTGQILAYHIDWEEA